METRTLTAETSDLLDLVINSLYTQKDIFLRELISNASDALDRLRIETLSKPEVLQGDPRFEIQLEVDPAQRTLTVRDSGIGMTPSEVVNYIGTVARSGTKEVVAQLDGQQVRDHDVALIGRFGVGFYSCFMVAAKVTVLTRRAGNIEGTRWESTGDVHYTISAEPDLPRGTSVTLHLKPVNAEAGLVDFTDRWTVSPVVKRYADFIAYPIYFVESTREADGGAAEASVHKADEMNEAPVLLNSMRPIWTRPESEVESSEYVEFYRHLCHESTDPLFRMSFKAEGRWEYTALLFIPPHASLDLYYHAACYGLQLYSQRVVVVDNCQDMMPRYLRFLKGVVDVADLPLNVSRQTIQHAHHLSAIRKWLTRKVIDFLGNVRANDSAKYLKFWSEFGRALKEGISEDYENRDRLVPLLLFASSATPSQMSTMSEYVARMKPDQNSIFYLTGESREAIERAPHLEEFSARGYEVLYLTDPVDELLVNSLREFSGHPIKSVAKGKVELGDDSERRDAEDNEKHHSEWLAPLLAFMAKHLESHVRSVRVSQRLTVSPACLTSEEFEYSPHIERLLLRGKGGGARALRILELNHLHPIVSGVRERLGANPKDPVVPMVADLLFGFAQLAEGSELSEPVVFNAQLLELLEHAVRSTRGTHQETGDLDLLRSNP